jgi:hypothetical protein
MGSGLFKSHLSYSRQFRSAEIHSWNPSGICRPYLRSVLEVRLVRVIELEYDPWITPCED